MNTSIYRSKNNSSKKITPFESSSASDTRLFGNAFGKELRETYFDKAVVLTLFGDLGAGKTTLIQGIARGLGIKSRVISPTFLLMRIYPFLNKKRKLFHIDAYRIENRKNAAIFKKESHIFKNPLHIVVIEWPEKISHIIPDEKITISLQHMKKENERFIKIS